MQNSQAMSIPLVFERRHWPALRWGAYVLVLFYAVYYFHDQDAPGNQTQYPLGWWGWWDQSQYLTSARNLAAGNLSPDVHWYPLGYSIAVAPLLHWFPAHGFFFLDLAALLISYLAFVAFAQRCGFSPILAMALFIVTSFGDSALGEAWSEPWNSSLSSALIWGTLAVSATLLDDTAMSWRPWRLFLFGLLAGAIPLVRPTDTVLSAIAGMFVLMTAFRAKVLRVRHILTFAAGAALVIVPYGILYLRIYGLHPTTYMLHESKIGFAFSRLGWKTYQLLVEPRPWYPDGQGLLTRFPWLVLSFAGLVMLVVPGWQKFRRGPLALLAVMILSYWTLFFAYVDLLPSGIWRYHNIHYLKWSFPALGLFAVVFLHRAFVMRRRESAIALILVVAVLSIRVVPVPADPNDPAEMVQFAGPPQGWSETYMGDWHFSDSAGGLLSVFDVHAIPDSHGVRILPLRRSIVGRLIWTDRPADLNGPTTYWKGRLSLGYPCWLPPYPCRQLAPRS